MSSRRLGTIMVFVDDPDAAARFWCALLDAPPHGALPVVEAGEVTLFFHPADPARNPQGGTVPYFAVGDFDHFRETLLAARCTPHRGPGVRPDGRRICQLRDPFGTIWGLEEA